MNEPLRQALSEILKTDTPSAWKLHLGENRYKEILDLLRHEETSATPINQAVIAMFNNGAEGTEAQVHTDLQEAIRAFRVAGYQLINPTTGDVIGPDHPEFLAAQDRRIGEDV